MLSLQAVCSKMRRGRSNSVSVEEEEEEEEEERKESCWKTCFNFLLVYSPLDISTHHGTGNGRSGGHSHGFVIEPQNRWYQLWTHFILIWAIYSSFFTPLEFAFFRGLPEDLFLLDIIGQSAFLIDIVIRFFVAYRDPNSHSLVYDHTLIAIRYLKSRFAVDLLGCLPWDYIYKVAGREELVRYILWIRLSRVLRVTELFEKLEKDIRINYLFIRIIKLFVVELYCTHTAACIFYYIATTLPPSQEGYTWIGSLKMGDYSYANFREINLWTRYVTSLYFAVVTMATVGYGEIHAVNAREMIFVMIYVSFDMVLGAYLLGNMTALIVKGSNTERFRDSMADLLKYMNRNKLGKDVKKDVERHIRLKYERGFTVASALQDIPIAIRHKVSQKLYEPFLRNVPLLKGCSDEFINQLTLRVDEEFFLPGEILFEEGNTADQLYFVCHGKLEVFGKHGAEEEDSILTLESYSSIGEVSVICNIPAQNTVRVIQLCRLLRIEKQIFIGELDSYFIDGRKIINNLLQGKKSNMEHTVSESDITFHIAKHESEFAMKLNCAAYDGDLHRLKYFIEAGADPNVNDYTGRSPLHVAAWKGYKEITSFLIEKGADVNAKDNFRYTPLLEAVKNGNDEVASLLANAGASLLLDNAGNCLCEAVASRDLDFLRRILSYGTNPNSKNYDLRTPLHIASSEGLYPGSVLLLEAGASVLSVDRWGKTPLDEARVGGNKSLIALLEDAQRNQLSQFSVSFERDQASGGSTKEKQCTVFPYCPWDDSHAKRQLGVVLRTPESMEELIKIAKQQLKVDEAIASCIVLENGGKILNIEMVDDGQNLFLVSEAP